MDSLGELAAIRASACELRSDFDQHQKKCNSYARPVSLNVAGVLDKVVDLAKSIDSLCLRDYSAYLQHVKELADGRKDESLATLNKLCSDAYKEIESRERMLNEILSSTKRAEEKLNDLVGSAERLERGVAPIKEALQVEMKEARVELQKAQEREKMMNDLARSAEESYKQAQAALDDKRRTNKNFFTGLGDWFSRKDDKFDVAYSLGINSGETDKIDNVKIEAMRDFSKVVEADANDAKAEWRSIVIAGRKARNAMKSIEKMLGQMQDLKGPAVRMIAKLEARENALAKIASAMTELENYLEICKGQRTLPTIEEMARKLFLVVIGAGHYEDFEDKVRARTRQLFAIADGLVKWQEVLENDDDDDLKERYEEAKVLASPSGKYAALLPTLQAKVEAAQHSLAAQLAA